MITYENNDSTITCVVAHNGGVTLNGTALTHQEVCQLAILFDNAIRTQADHRAQQKRDSRG